MLMGNSVFRCMFLRTLTVLIEYTYQVFIALGRSEIVSVKAYLCTGNGNVLSTAN